MTGSDYDDKLATSINFQIWLQVKRVNNLCNNDTVKKRGEEGYDHFYKYDYIWKFIVHNANLFMEEADIYLCGDETIWDTTSYGESGSGVTGITKKNPEVTKGGKTVLLVN